MRKNILQIGIGFLLILGLVLVVVPSIGHAQPQSPTTPDQINSPEDDGGTAEIGVEWITDWPGTADDRANWYYSATNLYNELGGAGWIKRFNYGNTNAWEKDFKAAMYGGINDTVIDSVDLAMIGTHGSSAWDTRYGKTLSSVYFSSNHDDWHLSPGEAYRAFGNNDLEWLAFDSCSVLRDDSMYYWHETFDGLHLMLGFANTMYVVYPGDGGVWGDQMQQKGWWIFGHGAKTVTQAWFTAVEDQQPSGVRARVLAETLDSYNDYIHGQGYVSPDYPNNGAYWYWDHVSGTPEPLALTAVPTSLPIITINQRPVDQTYTAEVGRAFGLTGDVFQSGDGSVFVMVGGPNDNLQLRVDAASGGFFFQNLDELWTDPERPRTLPQSTREAAALVSNFLAQNDYLPGAFDFDPQIPPTIELEGPTDGLLLPATIAPTTPTTPTNYAVHYARTVDIGGGQRLSIVGPGSRQNVYVGDNGDIIAFKGGWRSLNLQPGMQIQASTAVTVPIKTATEAWEQFLADPTIALAQLPIADTYDTAGQPEPTLAYYEQPQVLNQNELIPVWIFQANLYVDDANAPGGQALVTENSKIYIPAAADPATLPKASITSPTTGAIVMPGEAIDLVGEVTGGQGPYTFDWSAGIDGALGTGPTVNGVTLTPDLRASGLQPTTITLRVIDGNGAISTAEVTVIVMTPVYLPMLAQN
ncbi:MAG: hypothetical protein IPF56_15100 [Chloroflexi bacterium]|nr:hypothetical protein [Chloroflexota bacterium]MBK6709860.1 hypothetical protein [Chloroflexota bacterium]MBK8932633.1 hypothetical protein [Chloroflexota bacterium]